MKQIHTLLILLISTFSSLAQTVQLDPTWATQGYLIDGSPSDAGSKLLLQPDGKIIAFSYQRNQGFILPNAGSPLQRLAHQVLSLTRYNSNGTLDPTFGNAGRLQFYSGISNGYSFSPIPVLQSDDKILVSTSLLNADSSALDFAIYRITTTGHIDSAFGNNGLVRSNIDSVDNVNVAIFAFPDGKIIQAGMLGCVWCNTSGAKILVLQRFNSDGSRDLTYGVNGVIDSIHSCFARNVILRPSGGFMVQNYQAPNLYPILPDGSYDHSWNANYYAIPPGGIVPECIETADGIFAGYEGTFGPDSFVGITKLKAHGQLDTTFHHLGFSEATLLKSNIVKALAQQQDHKILLLSQSAYYDTTINGFQSTYNASIAITRFLPDGRIDSTFAENGIFLFDTTIVNGQLAGHLLVQPDGKILVIGNGHTSTQSGILVLRLLNQLNVGLIDFEADMSSLDVFPNPMQDKVSLQYELANDETISIEVYSLNGKKVQSLMSPTARTRGKHIEELNLSSSLSAGIYILQIINSSDQRRSVKIVLR